MLIRLCGGQGRGAQGAKPIILMSHNYKLADTINHNKDALHIGCSTVQRSLLGKVYRGAGSARASLQPTFAAEVCSKQKIHRGLSTWRSDQPASI